MSVYIRGMEMPKSKPICIVIDVAMKQEGEQQIIVPIDYEMAVKEANRRAPE